MMYLFFFFNDTATTEIYTLSLHDALPISAPREPRAVLRVRPPLPDPARPARCLQGALERRRAAYGPGGLRRRRPARPRGEEAVLPRLPRRARPVLRDARMRLSLWVLPPRPDLAGAARSDDGRAAAGRNARGDCGPRPAPSRAHPHVDLQRAPDHERVGPRGLPRR